MNVLILFLVATGTAVATGLGAVPVFGLGDRAARYAPALWGLTVGVMSVASVVGLLRPAFEDGSTSAVLGGLGAGVAFLLLARVALHDRDLKIGAFRGTSVRTAVLVFAVLFVHSLPEGFAIGTAYASDRAGLDVFVITAIAIQNVPEGTSVAIPMHAAGFTPGSQFWAAVLTSAPQPVGALVSYALVAEIHGLLPASFAFAAGAMLALVLVELAPKALEDRGWPAGLAGAGAGAALMLVLAAALGV